MQVLIDNFDGLGKVDYGAAIQFGKEATIARTLNKPTVCRLPLVLGGSLAAPAEGSRVQIVDRKGALLFTGYATGGLAVSAAGEQTTSLVETAVITAVSDESLLDGAVCMAGTTLLGRTAEQEWGALARGASLSVALSGQLESASRLQVKEGARWSETAGVLAGSTRSAYRALDGAINVAPIGQETHTIPCSDAGLRFESINQADLHWLAQDVTVLGHEEPRAYVTEIFQGDGVTASFSFSEKPFTPDAQQRAAISDLFQGTSLNPQMWTVSDAGGHIALAAGGLSCTGGSGRDGEASVASLQEVELGGSIVIEGGGVLLGSGSAGTLLGLYAGKIQMSTCFAGFAVSSSASELSVSPVVNGIVAGSAFQALAGRLYTFRLRVFGLEMERIRQTYVYLSGEGNAAVGGESVPSAGWLQFEIQDVTSGTPSGPVILFSGSVAGMPPACVVAPLSSGALVCSIKTISCVQTGSLWVGSGATGASPLALSIGTEVEGAACHLTTTGTLDLYPASVPPAGALISVLYRSRGRAAARRALALSSGGGQPVSAWIGSVTHPPAWSSVDCEYAARALLGMMSGNEAGWKGTYAAERVEGDEDFWPGDTLTFSGSAGGMTPAAAIRSVKLALIGGAPGVIDYKVEFANDWVEGLSLQVTASIPNGAVLPQALTEYNTALESLSGLSVSGVTGTALAIAAGAIAPADGGFEVRRRDDTFGPGSDSDLVLRTAASSFSIPRAAARERYFVRMYDGANPPNYSLMSAAIFVNVPQ